ncbi:MAG: hypothetical protein KDI90_11965 [Alphaproteobacteria bacterium]|nr:hypothetical protein [Alphaproteobacteria bacterium]MCB9975589.1 hypothetical protein [Rhodospirillales bacterium]
MKKNIFYKIAAFISLALLPACASLPEKPPQDFYKSNKIEAPHGNAFTFCSQYGCKRLTPLSISNDEWADISNVYGPLAQNAQQEREKISRTIARFEQIIGARTGTDIDIAGTFRKIGKGQLDCVDESTNTTSYLMLLEQNGFLRFHRVGAPDTRFPIVHSGRWPHQTAVIIEKENGKRYVVDSWFYDNGHPAVVLPIKTWKEGWKPDGNFR